MQCSSSTAKCIDTKITRKCNIYWVILTCCKRKAKLQDFKKNLIVRFLKRFLVFCWLSSLAHMQEGRRCRRSVFVSVRVFISKVTALRTESVAEFSCVITQFVFHLSVQLEHQATAKKRKKTNVFPSTPHETTYCTFEWNQCNSSVLSGWVKKAIVPIWQWSSCILHTVSLSLHPVKSIKCKVFFLLFKYEPSLLESHHGWLSLTMHLYISGYE